MKHVPWLFAATLAGATALAAQPTQRLSTAELQADFTTLRNALEEAHGALYRFSSKADLDRWFGGYRARLDAPMTKLAFIGLLSEMLAGIRDGHTRLEFDSATVKAQSQARVLPLRVLLEGPRVMVLSNDTQSDSTIRPGMELVSINGRPVSGSVPFLLARLSPDGFIETGVRFRLGRAFAQMYWMMADQSAEFEVAARDSSGRTVTARMAGILDTDREKVANPVNAQLQGQLVRLDGAKDNVSLTFTDDSAIARLRIRGFGGQDYPGSLETAFRTLQEKGTRALLLDLRGNGGGVDQYGAMLVSYFTDQPFRYFDHIKVITIRPSFATWKASTFDELRDGTVPDPKGGFLVTTKLHKGVDEQAPGKYPFLGKAFVLADGGTFSTAADVTAVLHNLERAKFVGEETGGAYEGNTSGLNALVTLPNSQLRLRVQMFGYLNAVSRGTKGRGTLADYPVEKRVADLLRGIDAPLERAVTLARAAIR